jgi:15-cis-phytoene desaturase
MAAKVVVLGGGIAGLTAAHELVERGFQVEIYESREVAGGKARSIACAGSALDRPDWPGEHGFRFVPGFYKHLPETMRRIPYPGNARGVFDNLVEAKEYMLVRSGGPPVVLQAAYPESFAEWVSLIKLVLNRPDLGIPTGELAFFVSRLVVILTSCQERRLAEYEKIAWWEFIEAEGKSDAYKTLLAVGLTRTLVALKAKEASTRTIGNILIQLLLDLWSPYNDLDRLLDGPTSAVWIDPWLTYLKQRGATWCPGSTVTSIAYENDRISGVTVQDANGVRTLQADDYVVALPVEQVVKLVSPALAAAEPALGALERLRVAWMNGIQFFLREDAALVRGHTNYVNTPSALTSISQNQFWRKKFADYGDGSAKGCLSCDISDWEAAGVVYGKPLRELSSAEQVKIEVLAQLRGALGPIAGRCLDDSNIAGWCLDTDIVFPNASSTTNLEPLLINTVDSWKDRPEAVTRIDNLFLAGDYVRTHTDLATMEAANEAARRAVNGILDRHASTEPRCAIYPLKEPALFAPARELDRVLFKLGRPHVGMSSRARAPLTHAPQKHTVPVCALQDKPTNES